MTDRNRELDEARAARRRWLEAIEAGRDHGTVSRMWESYTRLAGKDLVVLEQEAYEASK